jgi:hypothetical protein
VRAAGAHNTQYPLALFQGIHLWIVPAEQPAGGPIYIYVRDVAPVPLFIKPHGPSIFHDPDYIRLCLHYTPFLLACQSSTALGRKIRDNYVTFEPYLSRLIGFDAAK